MSLDKKNKNYLIYIITGILAGFAIIFIPGYVVFAGILGLLLFFIKKYSNEDFKFLCKVIIVSVLLRFIAIVMLEMFLIKSGDFVRIFGYQTPALFGDSGYYALRSLWMAKYWLGESLSKDIVREITLRNYGYHGYLYFLSAIYYLFGFDTILSRLFTSLFGILIGLNLFFIAKLITPERSVRRLTFIIVSFWPTLFLWSITHLRDIPVAFFISLFVLLLFCLMRAKSLRGIFLCIPSMLILPFIIRILKRKSELLLLLPSAIAVFTSIKMRFVKILLVMVLGIIVVFSVKTGLCGIFVNKLTHNIFMLHRGAVLTGGNVVKFLPEKYYLSTERGYCFEIPLKEAVKGILKGAFLSFLHPLPEKTGFNMVRKLTLLVYVFIWYTILLFGSFGFLLLFKNKQSRREIFILLFLILTTSMSTMIVSGNIGTLIRWRCLVEPYILFFTTVFLYKNRYKFFDSSVLSFFRQKIR